MLTVYKIVNKNDSAKDFKKQDLPYSCHLYSKRWSTKSVANIGEFDGNLTNSFSNLLSI